MLRRGQPAGSVQGASTALEGAPIEGYFHSRAELLTAQPVPAGCPLEEDGQQVFTICGFVDRLSQRVVGDRRRAGCRHFTLVAIAEAQLPAFTDLQCPAWLVAHSSEVDPGEFGVLPG